MIRKLSTLLLFLPIIIFSQEAGKIMGVVTDKSTGDPLPGVNILIEGMTLGAASDIDGYYVIVNVPVSSFTIRGNYIGYRDIVIQNVKVSSGITTELNFALEPTVLEMEDAIVVIAERPLIEKHVTQSISLVTSEEIAYLPVRGIDNLLEIQNSVVVQDGSIHIRGGRADEVGLYLDGASINSIYLNDQTGDAMPIINVVQEAIEEFQVLAGGYTAEFGGANAGIVRTELKTGTPDFHFSLDFQTDKFATEGKKFIDTYSYRQHIAVATISGPLFHKNIRFFLAGENKYLGDRQIRFSKGFQFENLVDTNPYNPQVTRFGEPDTVSILTYPDGFTPKNSSNNYALNGTMLFDFTPLRLRLSGSYNYSRSYLETLPMLTVLNNRQEYDDYNGFVISGKLTHMLSASSYYDINMSYFNSSLERGDEYFGHDWQLWWDSLAVAQHTDGEVLYRDRWDPQYNYTFYGIDFERNGHPPYTYRIYKETYLGGALNFLSQINRHHELKFGIDVRRYTIRRFQVGAWAMDRLDEYGVNSITEIDSLVWGNWAGVTNYGYDPYGREVNSGRDDAKHPTFIAFYLQDKIEFSNLIINAGLRYDYFNTDDQTLKNPTNPPVDPGGHLILEDAWETLKPFQQLSPRLGFSFPVSEKTAFYMQYGKFIQTPEFFTTYRGYRRISRRIVFGLGSVAFGLEPVRTTSYEIGFRQQLSRVAAFDITGFYRNIKGQVQLTIQESAPGAGIEDYGRYINGDFATTKGLELRFSLRRIQRLQAQINYTLTQAEGTASWPWGHTNSTVEGSRKTVIYPLAYNQPHRGSVNLDYRFAKNDGGPVLQQLGLNLLFQFNSGHPYTHVEPVPATRNPFVAGIEMNESINLRAEPVHASNTPWNFTMDLRIDKTISLWNPLQANLYLRVTNLLDTKNTINVYNMTGDAYDDGFLSNRELSQSTIDAAGGERYIEMYRAINLENGQAYWDWTGKQLYDHPRQIFLGVKLIY
jgi:hypothetical protein